MKTMMKNVAMLFAAAFVLAGCAANIESLKQQSPEGTAFDKILYTEYVALADAEAAEYDQADANTFAGRAQAILDGNTPNPEEISARELPEDRVRVLTAARERLMTALNNGGRGAAPVQAAGAQGAFDCWMQEQEENRQPADIDACAQDFIMHMERLETALAPAPVAAAPAPEEPALPPLPDPIEVLFDHDSASITAQGARRIAQAVTNYTISRSTGVRVVGHTDTSGSDAYNEALAMQRAEAVARSLRSRGLSVSAISTASVGEEDLAVETGDNVKEEANRRVVITFTR